MPIPKPSFLPQIQNPLQGAGGAGDSFPAPCCNLYRCHLPLPSQSPTIPDQSILHHPKMAVPTSDMDSDEQPSSVNLPISIGNRTYSDFCLPSSVSLHPSSVIGHQTFHLLPPNSYLVIRKSYFVLPPPSHFSLSPSRKSCLHPNPCLTGGGYFSTFGRG
jgi:hypothetical protein